MFGNIKSSGFFAGNHRLPSRPGFYFDPTTNSLTLQLRDAFVFEEPLATDSAVVLLNDTQPGVLRRYVVGVRFDGVPLQPLDLANRATPRGTRMPSTKLIALLKQLYPSAATLPILKTVNEMDLLLYTV